MEGDGSQWKPPLGAMHSTQTEDTEHSNFTNLDATECESTLTTAKSENRILIELKKKNNLKTPPIDRVKHRGHMG